MTPVESLMRSLETGLPSQYDAKPGARIYRRVIERCGQCHCLSAGTQFKASTCSQTGKEVLEFQPPPADCPLPLA